MRGYLRQGTAVTVVLGPQLDSTDGNTQETGATISQADVRLSKNGGAFAQVNESSAAAHMEAGYFSKALNATDVDTLGRLLIATHEGGALAVRGDYSVIEASSYDLMFASAGPVPHLGIVDRGTAQAATSTTTTLRSAAAFADNVLANAILYAFGSTQGYWQSVQITSNVGSTDVCTHPAWPVTPSGTITYYVMGVPGANSSLPFPADLRQWLGTALPTPHTNGYPIVTVKDGTGTGEIDTASGKITLLAADITSIQSGLATAAALTTVGNNVAAILADTGTDGVVIADAVRRLIAVEVLYTLYGHRGHKVYLDGTDIKVTDTDGTTVIVTQPFTRLDDPANPMASVG